MKVNLSLGNLEPMPSIDPNGVVMASPDRRALLVYCGKSESMDGPVEITEKQLRKLVDNHNSFLAKVRRMVQGEIPIRHYPPVQVDHSTSAMMTVGRVVGDLELGTHMNEDNEIVPAAYGTLRFLGSDNVERANDGRWTHFSIGADLDAGKLSEVTVTPFPAAADATLMTKGNEEELMGYKQAKESMAMYEKCRSHMKKHLKMEKDEEIEEKLSGMDDVSCKKMAADHDEAEKKLSSEKTEDLGDVKIEIEHDGDGDGKVNGEKLSEEDGDADAADSDAVDMSAEKKELTRLMGEFKASSGAANLAAKKARLSVRLARLKTSAKISPAEMKKINLTKLAAESDATIDAVFKSYENREPVIAVGVFGSTKSVDLAEIEKKTRLAKLEAETRKNMTTLSKNPAPANQGSDVLKMSVTSVDEGFNTISGLFGAGKLEEGQVRLKECLTRLSSGGEASSSGVAEAEMSALADSVKKMQTQFEQVIRLTSKVVGKVN